MRKSYIIAAMATMALILSVGYFYLQSDNGLNSSKESQIENNNSNAITSSVDNEEPNLENSPIYQGTVVVKGYAVTETVVCNPGDMCDQTRDKVTFVYAESGEDWLNDFVGIQNGNPSEIVLGCYLKNPDRIYYENLIDDSSSADGLKMITGSIAGSEFNKLMDSSSSNPVQLQITRGVYTGGRGAPDCYSHFKDYKLI